MESKPRSKPIVNADFSRNHFADNESCCPLVALPSAVARQRRGEQAYRGNRGQVS
jgi:hypothetical protein